jgi:hypothetical protein
MALPFPLPTRKLRGRAFVLSLTTPPWGRRAIETAPSCCEGLTLLSEGLGEADRSVTNLQDTSDDDPAPGSQPVAMAQFNLVTHHRRRSASDYLAYRELIPFQRRIEQRRTRWIAANVAKLPELPLQSRL